GLFAGVAYAIYGPAAYIDTAILAEGVLMFLLSVALWQLSSSGDGDPRRARSEASRDPRLRETVTIAAAALTGVAFGAGALVRPTALVIATACALWLVSLDRRRVWIFAACVLVVVAPALAKNWATSRTLGIQGYGGLNVYIGNSPLHDGRATFRLGAGWDALNSEATRR